MFFPHLPAAAPCFAPALQQHGTGLHCYAEQSETKPIIDRTQPQWLGQMPEYLAWAGSILMHNSRHHASAVQRLCSNAQVQAIRLYISEGHVSPSHHATVLALKTCYSLHSMSLSACTEAARCIMDWTTLSSSVTKIIPGAL